MKAFKLLCVSFLLVSCGATVNVDFDEHADFTQYKTYNYFNNIESGMSALDLKRFTRALDSKLQSRGFRLTEPADFYIDIQSETYQGTNGNGVGVGVGGTGRNVGGGISVGFPIGGNSMMRQIQLDFVNKDGKKLLWQAISESRFNPNAKPEKREAQLKAVVEKMMAKYPPKS